MAGLNCGTPSMLAWPYLRDGLDAAVAVANAEAAVAARNLAGYGIPAGPCGGAALAGVRAALTGEGAGSKAGLAGSRPGRHGGAAEHRRIRGQPGSGRLAGQALVLPLRAAAACRGSGPTRRTASALVRHWSLSRLPCTCISTVRGLMNKASPICRLVLPLGHHQHDLHFTPGEARAAKRLADARARGLSPRTG